MVSVNHKRGDSFFYVMSMPSVFSDGYFSGWSPQAQIKTKRYQTYIDDLNCAWVDDSNTRTLYIQKIDTSNWPIGEAEMDVLFVRGDGYTEYTDTIRVIINKNITTSNNTVTLV